MKKTIITLATLLAFLGFGVYHYHTQPTPTISYFNSTCVSINHEPDKKCNPGSINENVTQETINSTICVSGFTSTIRPISSYTNQLKLKQMKDYGFAGNISDYEEDHIISLELGGHPTDPKNLWPESWNGTGGAHDKDKFENYLHKLVCNKQMTLSEAQKEISTDWFGYASKANVI